LCGERKSHQRNLSLLFLIQLNNRIMTEPATAVKLFGRWALDEVEITDLSLVVS
jgi:hypothetical protein